MSKARAKSAAGNYAAGGTSMLPAVPAAHKADPSKDKSLSSTLDGIDELLMDSSNAGKLPKPLKLRALSRPTSRSAQQKPPGSSSEQSKGPQDSPLYTPMSVEVPREPLRFSSTEDAAWPRKALAASTSAKTRKRAGTVTPNSPPKSPSQKHMLRRRSRTASVSINDNASSRALETQAATADDAVIENPPPASIRLDDSDEDDLQEVEEKARDASRAGDNARAASICIRGIKLHGEEPALMRIFKESCARLGVTPALHSYPSRVVLLTATRLLIGDDIPISYCIHQSQQTGTECGFLALFYADDQMDAKFEELMKIPPSQVDHAGIDQQLTSPSQALLRQVLTTREDSIFLCSHVLHQKGRYIVRYYHQHNALWPVAQSPVIETFFPSILVSCPHNVEAGKRLEVTVAFQKAELSARERQKLEKEAAAQGAVDGRRGTDSNLLSRAAHVTRGDRLIISVLHSNCAPPPDLSVPIQEWTGQGRISVDYMYIPGRYSIKYVSSMCQGHVLGEAQVDVDFASITSVSTALTREMRLFIAVESRDTEAELQLMSGKLQQKMQRVCEHLFLSFTLLLLGQEAEGASSSSTMGILLRNLTDLDESLPYMIAILPNPHTYGKLPRLEAPVAPAATVPPQPAPTSQAAQPPHPPAKIPKHDASNASPQSTNTTQAADAQGKERAKTQDESAQKKESKWSLVKVDEGASAGTGQNLGQKSLEAKSSSILTQKMRNKINDNRSALGDLSVDDAQLLSSSDFEEPDGPGAISQVTRILSLRKSPLLKDIPSTDLRALAHSSVLRKLEPGSDLIRVGTISGALYTILNGSLSVLIANDKIQVATIGSGGMVGEMSMLTGEPAGATCRATEGGCSVLEITKDTMMRMVQERATLREHLDAFVSARLAANAQMLEKAAEKKARDQEEQMQKDDGDNLFEEHPWVSLYRNSHLEARQGVLPASFFELQLAYGLLLRPQRTNRALILNRFPAPKPRNHMHIHHPPSTAASKAPTNDDKEKAAAAWHHEDDVLEKAAIELHQSCRRLSVEEYSEPEHAVDKCLDFLSRTLLEDFAGPVIHSMLWRIHLINEQILERHLSGHVFGVSDVSTDLFKAILPPSTGMTKFAGKVVLVEGPPCSGKTSLLCQTIQRLTRGESMNEGLENCAIVSMQKGLDGIKHWPVSATDDGQILAKRNVYVSVNFASHYLANTNTFYDLLLKLVLELQAAGLGREEMIASQLCDLKTQLRTLLGHASVQAHIVWIIDGADCMQMDRADWEYLQVLSEDEGSLVIVIAHQTKTIPPRLAKFASVRIDLSRSESLGVSMKTVAAMYLSDKLQEQLCDPVISLIDSVERSSVEGSDTQAPEQMSPGVLRLVLDWSLFHVADFTSAQENMRKRLCSCNTGAVQGFLADIDNKYRSYGDFLRFLAIARPGLTEYELLALIKARNSNSTMESARFARFRAEMTERRIIVVICGVIDFASSGLRTAAHDLFLDNQQRHLYVKVMLEWLQNRSKRSPRRMVLFGQLCKDMCTQCFPWIPDTNPKSQLLFLTVAGDGKKEKTKPKMWGDSQDWLTLLVTDLSDPVIIALAGGAIWTTRQYIHLMSSARILEQASNKKQQAARNRSRENEESEEQTSLSKFATLRTYPIFEHVFSEFLQNGLKELYSDYFCEDGSTSMEVNMPMKSFARVPSEGLEGGAHEDLDSDPYSVNEMEKHSFLLDCATTAQLMLSHKQQSEGALDIVNLATTRLYGIMHISMLDDYHSLAHGWRSVASVEPYWIAFAAHLVCQRWQEHQKTIRAWALQARSICMERLRLTPSPDEAFASNDSDFIHNSTAMDEGTRLQARKDKIIFTAETIIDLADIIGGKLEVECRKLRARARSTSKQSASSTIPQGKAAGRSSAVEQNIVTDFRFDGDPRFEDLALRSSVFWCKFDPLTQLETMRKAQGEMLELEKTFGMDRVFEGLTSTQRMHVYISARKANSWWVNGLILRKFKEWKRRALQRRGSRPPPSRGSTAPQRSTSRIA